LNVLNCLQVVITATYTKPRLIAAGFFPYYKFYFVRFHGYTIQVRHSGRDSRPAILPDALRARFRAYV